MQWQDRTNRAVFTWQEPRRKGNKVSHKLLLGRLIVGAMKIKSRRATAGCERQLDGDQQKRSAQALVSLQEDWSV